MRLHGLLAPDRQHWGRRGAILAVAYLDSHGGALKNCGLEKAIHRPSLYEMGLLSGDVPRITRSWSHDTRKED